MSKIFQLYRNSSIRSKLICSFVLIILITTMLIASLSGMLYRREMISEQNDSLKQMVYQISSSVDSHVQEMEHVMDTLAIDPRVTAYLSQPDGQSNKSLEESAYEAVLTEANLYSGIAGVMVVSPHDNYVSNVMYQISSEPLTEENWYTQAVRNPGRLQLFSKPVGRNINNIFQYSADDVVSISKSVMDAQSGACKGVILIDVKLEIIKAIIESIHPSSMGFIYMIDSKEEIVYSPVNPTVNRIKNEWFRSEHTGSLTKNIGGKSELFFYNLSNYTKWKTVGVFPLDESQKVVTIITYTSYGIALLVMGLSILLAILSARLIANPITKLRLLMKSAEKGNFDVHFHNRYNDEIGQLGESYNTMIDKISELIHTVQIQEKNKRKAEIEVLQAQIKPHFLYNTMDTIQWMAQEHDAQDIVALVENLTSMLRIGLSRGNDIISVGMEIKHVESYLMIQKTRYEDKLNYEIQVNEQLMPCLVVKLILQPLVENAIYHGIKEKRGQGMIRIIGSAENHRLHFQVIDNGIGIPPEKLEQINSSLKKEEKTQHEIGYGIYNVNTKIRLTFGDEYGLRFHSIYGEGTTVDVWHPLIDKWEESAIKNLNTQNLSK